MFILLAVCLCNHPPWDDDCLSHLFFVEFSYGAGWKNNKTIDSLRRWWPRSVLGKQSHGHHHRWTLFLFGTSATFQFLNWAASEDFLKMIIDIQKAAQSVPLFSQPFYMGQKLTPNVQHKSINRRDSWNCQLVSVPRNWTAAEKNHRRTADNALHDRSSMIEWMNFMESPGYSWLFYKSLYSHPQSPAISSSHTLLFRGGVAKEFAIIMTNHYYGNRINK